MYKLFMVIYTATGGIGGTVGPLGGEDAFQTCEVFVLDARVRLEQHPELPRYKFECEYHIVRPQLTKED